MNTYSLQLSDNFLVHAHGHEAGLRGVMVSGVDYSYSVRESLYSVTWGYSSAPVGPSVQVPWLTCFSCKILNQGQSSHYGE